MVRCCGRSNPDHDALLATVGRFVALPEGAQVWGAFPDRGWAWRIVTRYGADLAPPVGSPDDVSACLAGVLMVDHGDVITVSVVVSS